ncbi:uncharacterized protein LOC122240498 isoform X2 [Panthera tigris]|uniref:uncharacterized protein LOC122240498 isoform X2 n=1 Tax=Panthera tigris TaxID=9694 RepID=UPI001C6F6983|nr:uncharacterized protein LOC122240498 isoform X2 [Panthera tigris]
MSLHSRLPPRIAAPSRAISSVRRESVSATALGKSFFPDHPEPLERVEKRCPEGGFCPRSAFLEVLPSATRVLGRRSNGPTAKPLPKPCPAPEATPPFPATLRHTPPGDALRPPTTRL